MTCTVENISDLSVVGKTVIKKDKENIFLVGKKTAEERWGRTGYIFPS